LSIAVEILVIVLVLVIAAAVWIAIHAVDAAGRLDAVHDDIARVRADLIADRNPNADLREAQVDAHAAEHDTHDPVWFLASWVPPVRTVRGLSSAVDSLATKALPPVVTVGSTLEPAKLRVAPDRIALAPLRAAAAPLTSADTALTQARDQVAALPGGWFGLLNETRNKVASELTSLTGSIGDAARFARAGPDMLGQHGLQRYFVGIQNNAESRATGGLVAAYAIVTADHGTIHVVQRGNDSRLRDPSHPTVSLGSDYDGVYGNYGPSRHWITSNLSPNFPDAADIWAHLWQAQSRQHIDGVFGVDPFGLAAMLGATGEVSVAGYPGVYTGANLARFIESKEYAVFAGTDQTALRKGFVSKVAGAVLHKLLSGSGSASAITTALGRAAGEGHLALWSATSADEAQISGTPLAGELPAGRGPFASLSIDSATGSKLDYYLDRSLDYRAGSCSGSTRDSTITVRLRNDAPRHGLPAYVRLTGNRDLGTRFVVEKVPRNRLFVFIHATAGAALLNATNDGRPMQVGSGIERGHPVYSTEVTVDPGAVRTLTIHLQEPVTPGPVATQVQPMARAQRTVLDVPACH
jgi:hypothetical protein